MRGLSEDVALYGRAELIAGETGGEVELCGVERKHGEHVVVNETVVPRRARAVVSEVVAFHVRVSREPTRVVVATLATSVRAVCGVLTVGDHPVGERARLYLYNGWGKAGDDPMEEVGTREIAGDFTPLLIDVIGLGRDIGVVAEDGERLCAFRCAGPGKMRIPIRCERDVRLRIGDTERIVAGDSRTVCKTRAGQLHNLHLRRSGYRAAVGLTGTVGSERGKVPHTKMAASLSGKLLVANPLLEDPNFFRTVVLLFEHGDEGAFGTVLNRPTDESASEHLPAWADLIAPPDVVFVGGPVRNEIAVGVAEWPSEDAAGESSLFSGIGFIDLTDPPDAETTPLRVRVYSGYSGWDAGQLEVELAVDSWFVLDPVVADVFGDPDGLWSRVLERQPGRLSLYSRYPDDLSLN